MSKWSDWQSLRSEQGVRIRLVHLNSISHASYCSHSSAMSGGYHGSSVDSPGKHNTRTKYSSIVQLSAPVVPIVSHGPVLHHIPLNGGYYNLPFESPGKYSSRVKYASILSNAVFSAAPVASHIFTSHHIGPMKGGFQNRTTDSPGKHNTRVKYSTIRPASVPVVASVVPITAYAHPIKGGYYNNAPLESPGKYSSRVKYTSHLLGVIPASASASRASSAAAPSPSKASVSQAQIDAVQKQYVYDILALLFILTPCACMVVPTLASFRSVHPTISPSIPSFCLALPSQHAT